MGKNFNGTQINQSPTISEKAGADVADIRTGTIVDGILAQATSNERELTKHLWDQKLHSLTHTLVVSGRCDLKKSDILAYEEKAYLVLAVDNAGDLGVAGVAYLEERNDLK